MKKKILFMIINMNVGGTEKALLTMLEEIDDEYYARKVCFLLYPIKLNISWIH